ncbi:MAG: DUF4294 domain-containing protein [Muribaculaceae bacterium]|jgi:hypothetical protein|nr:DUF4294 domain-containing protein [Muribaculaceae bacterium]
MRFLILILFLTIIRVVFAGEPVGGDTLVVGAPDIRVVLDSLDLEAEVRQKVYRGKYHMVTEEGDTVLMLVMNPVTVFPPLKFKNKKQEQFYWRTVRDVKKTLPYAKLICATLLETYEYIETFPTQKEREEYLKRMEKEVFEQYKPVLKQFTRSQARLLVKLIQRETNQSGYDILKAFLGSFRAGFWQTFGRLFGVNLKGQYRPDSNSDDAIIERVCVAVEMGVL